MTRVPVFLTCVALFTAGCGGSSPQSPAGPSTVSQPSSGATISGTLRSGVNALSAATSGALGSLTVTVPGTNIVSGVDAAGRFALASVPGGSAQLHVSGSGIDAPVLLTPVTTSDSVELVLQVSGTIVYVSSEMHNGQPVAPQVVRPVEANGTIEHLTGSAADFQFTIGSTVIKGDITTSFFGDGDKPDAFADLHNGARVEVKADQRDGFAFANRIHINDSSDGQDGSGTGQDSSASIHGVLTAISGSGNALTLTVDSTTVRTSSATEVKRRGDVQTLAALKVGQSLHVVGTRRTDGSLDARLIEIDDDAPGGAFEIEGSIGGLKGTCPAVHFGVNGYGIDTSSATVFDGVACTALKSGDKVNVQGLRQADGSVKATRVRRQ